MFHPATLVRLLFAAGLWLEAVEAGAHVTGEPAHDELSRLIAAELSAERATRPPPAIRRVTQVRLKPTAVAVGDDSAPPPPASESFRAFAPAVRVRWDENFLFVESNGLPAHGMMVGITAWQQQVPLPQPYTGTNAWRIPRHPQPSPNPVSIKNRFLRGAIALAANGIPIFNPQNNRGEVSQEIGELDQWGGHCGRADDYHYHAAPLHLQATLGLARPVAFALDGYGIYGLTEPDGSAPQGLDAFNGHETAALGYHYHASLKYPYVNGGFHGVVVERDGQVDPQPRAQSIRPALTALRGTKIVGFTGIPGQTPARLDYTLNGKSASISYTAKESGVWAFQFVGADGSTRNETYQEGAGGGGGAGGGKNGKGPPNGKQRPAERERPPGRGDGEVTTQTYMPKRTGMFALSSPVVAKDGVLPIEFTGDGAGISPPLAWSGAPAGTKSFAVIMHHVDPEGKTKWYWTLYDIPADVDSLPKDAQGIGTMGSNSVTRRVGYAPPHSKGPGAKTYVLTAYALAVPLKISASQSEVSRDVLLAAMKDVILDSAELSVVHTRSGAGDGRDSGRDGAGTTKARTTQ
jgi:phosphatidylethanolamine-binding protein (PEBP) family uncharacterized protein